MTTRTDDLTAQITAIWDRYGADVRWAVARLKCGDPHRHRTGLQGAWVRVERAFAALGEPVNGPRHRPELKLIAGEHPIFVDPPAPANDTRCLTCDGTGRLEDGRPCQFCQPGACRPVLLTEDAEEPTAIEGTTLQLPALGPDAAALEADINRGWALHDGRIGDAFDAALARIDAELARVGAAKAVR